MSRISATHLALAYDDQVRSLYHAMQAARRAHRTESAAYCRDHLATLLVIRANARRDFVTASTPLFLTVAWQQAEQ